MAAIARHPLENAPGAPAGAVWTAFAAQLRRWVAARGLPLRDVLVLLPFAQLLAPAREAFAAQGGWQPRVETTQSLARSLGPATPAQALQLSFDAALDALNGARLLRAQAQGAAWARRDSRGFAQAVAALVQTATDLARAAASVPPAQRAAHWEAGRQQLGPLAGPGARERWLARIALEWAAQAPTPLTDRLFALHPAAWVVLQAGGADPLAEALLAQTGAGLVIDADAALDEAAVDAPALAVCAGFESEARRAAALVLAHCAAGRVPVALVGQDRLLVRRVRALLERRGLQPQDETGWSLPTTRAAALLMGLLRAADEQARSDELFDALKSLPDGALAPPAALERLEQTCRRDGLARVADLARLVPGSPEAATADALQAALAPLAGGARPLARWLADWRAVLEAVGAWAALQADDAGQQALRSLRLHAPADGEGAWADAAQAGQFTRDEFAAWADQALAGATFRPVAAHAEVVVVPMARLLLRPFAAIVWPGADERQLGAAPPPHPLLDAAAQRLLGLDDAARQQARERLLFAHALRLPQVTFLRRASDGGEPRGDSPLLQRLALALASRVARLAEAGDPQGRVTLAPAPFARPAPPAPGLLPAALSASAAEALRACPYRFHARHQLRLREDEELDEAVEKREYGTWLHAVLLRFHTERTAATAPATAAQEIARLLALADDERVHQGLPEDVALPFAASLEGLAPLYVAWLQAREATGTRFEAGEQERRLALPGLPEVELYGVLDRIDRRPDGTPELLDYKTGSASSLKDKLRAPLEDTQLAFYAALLDPTGTQALAAAYLPLDTRDELAPLPHPQVGRSAQRLLVALAGELARVRDGAPLPALGEGRTCELCEARGLCRRDDWSAP